MARDWEISRTLADLETRMAGFGENTAEYPISMTCECVDNKLIWVVIAHIRIKRVTEFEVEGIGATLSDALRACYLGFNNPAGLMRAAERSHAAFGLNV